jgi:hypothetical protein
VPPLWRCYTAVCAAPATAAALPQLTPSCHHRAASKLLLQSCRHRSHRRCAVAMLPLLPLPPLLRYGSRHQAAAAPPPPSCRRCWHHCRAIAMLPPLLLPLLPHCHCRCIAAATKLLPPSCRSYRRAAAKLPPQLPLPSCIQK